MKLTIQLAALAAIALIPASADTITIIQASSIANATADRNTWLTENFGAGATPQALTGFENDADGSYTSLATAAGTFSVVPGSLPTTGNGTHKDDFTVLNSSESPFQGRYNTTPGGKNWLDSNDITKLQLTTSDDTIYFFMTDVDDTGGKLTIQTEDGSTSSAFTKPANGDLYFVAITGADAIGYIRWLNTSQADGYGLDDFGTVKYSSPLLSAAPVPEPASWIILGVAMFLLWAAVGRRERKERP
jgi:hypothetical protein